jgi:hypothetical protein
VKKMRWFTILCVTLALGACILALGACSPAVPSPVSPTADLKATVQVEVLQTLTAIIPPTKTAALPTIQTPTATITPAPAVQNTLPAGAAFCDSASFAGDVTIPDGVSIPPGSSFKKTWALKNTGGCTWNSSYALVFLSGDSMNTPTSVALSGDVAPGQMTLVSVELTAPTTPRSYVGFFKLRDPQGNLFGWGPTADKSFWVKINVANEYYFLDNLCSARWQNATDLLYCPGKTSDPKGYYLRQVGPTSQESTVHKEAALLMAPQAIANGQLSGTYNPVLVPAGAHLRSEVGCIFGMQYCNAAVGITFSVDGAPEQNLGEWKVSAWGQSVPVDVNLESLNLVGKAVSFKFYVSANGEGKDDLVFWINPRLTQ